MNRIINFRPLFYCFLALAYGIASAYYLVNQNLIAYFITFLIFGLVLFFSIYRKQLKIFIAVFIAFAMGIGFYFIAISNCAKNNYDGQKCTVEGRVVEGYTEFDNGLYLLLTNVKINDLYEKNINVCVLDYTNFFEVSDGQILHFSANIYNEKQFIYEKFNSYAYKNNAFYFCTVSAVEITKSNGYLTFAEKVRSAVKNILYSYIPDNDIAELCYSALFGEKSALNPIIKQNFQVVGIAHMLAVSGLHIGFLVLILFFLLKKFKIDGIKRFLVILFFLSFYCYLCGFSPSIVRASLMCLIVLLLNLLGKNYDFLSSIGLAGILILLIKPLYVFDIGFQMSFLCVIFIAIFSKSVSTFIHKYLKIPQKISLAISVDFCTTLSILPILAIYFKKISFLTMVANLLCLPLFGFGFMALFVCTFISFIPQIAKIIFLIPYVFFLLVVKIANFIASLSWSIISLPQLNIVWYLFFYFSLFVLSGFLMIKFFKKVIIIGLASIIAVVFVLTMYPPFKSENYSLTIIDSYSTSAVFTTPKDKRVLVFYGGTTFHLEKYLDFKRIYKLDYIFSTPNTKINKKFLNKYKVSVESVVYDLDNITTYDDMQVEYIKRNGKIKAIFLNINKIGFVFAVERIGTENQVPSIRDEIHSHSIEKYILYEKRKTLNFQNTANYDTILSYENVYKKDTNNLVSLVLSSFTFDFDNGIIENIRSYT